LIRVFLFLLIQAAAASAQNNFLISRPVPDAEAVERGKTLFVPSCGFCHGPDATGGEGPDLLRSAVALRDEGGDEIGPVIHSGRPGMPAFSQMTDAQIKDLAAFIRFRQQAAINRGAYELKEVNTGDTGRGQTYFAAHCATCHSASGDMKQIALKYEPAVLMTKILYPRGTQSHATVTAGAAKVTGVLEYLDDFEVGVRDAEGEYHAFTRGPKVIVALDDPLEAHVKQMKIFQDRDLHDVLAYLETLR
jgi:cytochrome c oxidase cbb3-type subunit 3